MSLLICAILFVSLVTAILSLRILICLTKLIFFVLVKFFLEAKYFGHHFINACLFLLVFAILICAFSLMHMCWLQIYLVTFVTKCI